MHSLIIIIYAEEHFLVRYIVSVKFNFPLSLRCCCSVSGEVGDLSVRKENRGSVKQACTAVKQSLAVVS